ncbi:PAS domain-containing protein [candidate division KSB1 bacterium]|nr:PAS domain-containing protein [candidate division KSB1 bacterium]
MGPTFFTPPFPQSSWVDLFCTKIVEQLPFGLIWLNDRGTVVWANDHQRDFTGRSGKDLIGVSVLQDPDLVATGLAVFINLIFETPTAQFNNVPAKQVLYDSNGKKAYTVQFYPIIKDTALQGIVMLLLPRTGGKAGKISSLQYAKLQALLTSVHQPVFFIDQRYHLGRYSDSLLRLVGNDRIRKGQSCHQVLYNRKERCEKCPAAKVFETCSAMQQFPRPLDGSADYYCALAAAVLDDRDGVSQVCVSLAMQSDRETAGDQEIQELTSLNLLYRDMLDALPGIAVVIDPEQQIITANAAFYRAQGGHKTHVLGHNLFSFQPYRGMGRLQNSIRRCLQNQERAKEIILESSEGLPLYRHTVERLGKYADLQVILVYSESIQTLAGRLNRRVAMESAQKMGSFMGRLAHDLKNPLSVMMGQMDILRMYEIGNSLDNEKLFTELDVIHKNAVKMQKLIERIGLLQNHEPDDLQTIQVFSLFDKVVTMAHIQRPYKEVRVEWSSAPEMPDMVVCENRMETALLELLRNALEAAGPAGEVKLNAVYETAKDRFIMQLVNSGTTVPADQIDHILLPFASTKKENGAGLGLPIAHAIIIAHGGDLRFSSKPETGTVVTIVLPRNPQAEQSRAETGSKCEEPNPPNRTG